MSDNRRAADLRKAIYDAIKKLDRYIENRRTPVIDLHDARSLLIAAHDRDVDRCAVYPTTRD